MLLKLTKNQKEYMLDSEASAQNSTVIRITNIPLTEQSTKSIFRETSRTKPVQVITPKIRTLHTVSSKNLSNTIKKAWTSFSGNFDYKVRNRIRESVMRTQQVNSKLHSGRRFTNRSIQDDLMQILQASLNESPSTADPAKIWNQIAEVHQPAKDAVKFCNCGTENKHTAEQMEMQDIKHKGTSHHNLHHCDDTAEDEEEEDWMITLYLD